MNISDELLALCELSNDLLFHKIPEKKYLYYIKKSIDAGKSAAKQYMGQDIRLLYEKSGITINYSDQTNSYCGVQFRAHVSMDKKETVVTLYTKSLNEFAENSSFAENACIDYDTALNIHLCHEFYHFLEYKTKLPISEVLDSVETIKLPFFIRKAHINRCSEVAAHAFAKEMLQLSYLPNIYDYIYLINTSKVTQEDFEKLLLKFSNKV